MFFFGNCSSGQRYDIFVIPFAPQAAPLCSGKGGRGRGVKNFISGKLCANIAAQFYHFPQDVSALKQREMEQTADIRLQCTGKDLSSKI